MTALPAPTKADLFDEASNLVKILVQDDIAPKTIRTLLNHVLKGRKSADVIENANNRTGLRVADTWDYASDLQDCVRQLLQAGASSKSINTHLNRAFPRTEAQRARLASDRARMRANGLTGKAPGQRNSTARAV